MISPLNTSETRPSSLVIGWCPPETSMMLKRRMPKPKSPSAHTPVSSGPRCTIVAHCDSSTARSTAWPPRRYQPLIPHI